MFEDFRTLHAAIEEYLRGSFADKLARLERLEKLAVERRDDDALQEIRELRNRVRRALANDR